MSSRRERRRFRAEAAKSLLTFLCAPTDPALRDMPILHAAAGHWLDALSVRVRHCIICSSWLADRDHVGLVLLAAPATARPSSASCCGVCRGCADADLPIAALERACATVLHEVIPNGCFEPVDPP